jgi:tRNA (guanine9-N1)-methyltransferase
MTRTCRFEGPAAEATKQQFPGCSRWHATFHKETLEKAFDEQASLVYLTADADTEISKLCPGKGYVIGGLVDRNRHKRICLDKAANLGLNVARLPISDHLKLAGSKVCLCLSNVPHTM